MTSRRSHHAENTPAYAGAPTERLKYAPSIALEPEDERERPDDHRRAEDQDTGLPQRLAEEAEDAQAEDLVEDPRRELRDIAESGDPVARGGPHAVHYLITEISGCVASSVCVKT